MCRPLASPLRRAHLGLLCLSLVACNRPTPAAQVTSEAVQPGEKLPAPTPKPAPKAAPKPAPKLAPKPAAPNPVREQPAPTQPKAVGAVELIMATPEVPADIVIHNAVAKASEDGKDVLVYVGASWCAPCVIEMPFIQEIFKDKEWSDTGLVILGINAGEDRARVERFIRGNGLSFPVLLDINQSVTQEYNIRGFPTTFFIDKDGIIQEIKIGPLLSRAQIEWRLRKLIQY